MELIVINPTDMAVPEPRHFDGPLSGLLASTLKAPADEVPGFNTVSERGVIRRCRAFCNSDAKQGYRSTPRRQGSGTSPMALKRQGLERGLRREDGSIAD